MMAASFAWLMLGGRKPDGSSANTRRAAETLDEAADTSRADIDRAAVTARDARHRFDDAAAASSERMAGARATAGDLAGEAGERASTMMRQAGEVAADATDRMGEMTSDALSRAAELARSGMASASGIVSDATEGMADRARRTGTVAADSTRQVSRRAIAARNAMVSFCREQPLVVAGLGLALGAAVASLLPQSEVEDQIMGGASDAIKQATGDVAADQVARARAVGERAVEAALREADAQELGGVTSSSVEAGEDTSIVPSHGQGDGPTANADTPERSDGRRK
jgi:hypothetical protein